MTTRTWQTDGHTFTATYDRRTCKIMVTRDGEVIVDTVVMNFNDFLRRRFGV